MLRTAFPDAHYTLEDRIAESDKGAARWTFRGMHQGEFIRENPLKGSTRKGEGMSGPSDSKTLSIHNPTEDMGGTIARSRRLGT